MEELLILVVNLQGIFGFRVQDPFVERGLNFKIKENQDMKEMQTEN